MGVMTLQLSHHHVAKVQTPELHFRATLGGFELVFQMNGDTVAADDRNVWVAIHSISVGIQKAGVAAVSIGSARPGVPMRFMQDAKQRHFGHEFVLPLSPSQIQAIEDMRDGGDLTFQIAFAGEGGYRTTPDSYFPLHDMHSFTVPRSTWLERLRQIKAADVLLLEIPMPFMDEKGKAGPVAKHLREAQRMFAEGHYSKAVLDCRKALEALGKLQGRNRNWGAVALDRLAAVNRNHLTLEEREIAAQASLHHFAGLSSHDGDYSRNDAKLALMLCAAYLTKAFAS